MSEVESPVFPDTRVNAGAVEGRTRRAASTGCVILDPVIIFRPEFAYLGCVVADVLGRSREVASLAFDFRDALVAEVILCTIGPMVLSTDKRPLKSGVTLTLLPSI